MDRKGFFFRRSDHVQGLRRAAKKLGEDEGLGRRLETADGYFSLPATDKIAELPEGRILNSIFTSVPNLPGYVTNVDIFWHQSLFPVLFAAPKHSEQP